MSETSGQMWKKLTRRGAPYSEDDGPFFVAVEAARGLGAITEGEFYRCMDYSAAQKLRRLHYKVVRRGPVSDIVVPVDAWVEWITAQNPGMTREEAERLAYPFVLRTYNRRKENKSYPREALRRWLYERSPLRADVMAGGQIISTAGLGPEIHPPVALAYVR